MSVLTQFFGGGGGSPTSIRTRVQVTEGGHGASCIQHCLVICTNTGTCGPAPYFISGRGGGVGDFNLNIEPGTTCAITVGAGGASYACPFNIGPTQPMLPSSEYPAQVSGANCGPYLCGKWGCLGGPSKFGNLGFYPMGTTTSYAPRVCLNIPTSSYCLCITNDNFPAINLNCLCPTDNVVEQNVPSNSVGQFTTYTDFNKGFRGFDAPPTYSCVDKIIDGNNCTCVCMWCQLNCPNLSCGACCLSGAATGGGADNCKQIDRWSDFIYTEACCSFGGACCCATRIRNYFDCGGYTSYITGATCSYGVGGFITRALHTPDQASQAALVDAPCGKGYCCGDHTQFRFPGSGAGASSVYCTVLVCPTIPCTPVCPGQPGSVIVQYPTCYAAATTSSPSVVDCSPNTPGMRTYKFLCPGSITFP